MILRERVADDNLIVCWRGFNAKLQGGGAQSCEGILVSLFLLSNYAIFLVLYYVDIFYSHNLLSLFRF